MTLDSARKCFLHLPAYGAVDQQVGEAIFIWISEAHGGAGLTYRGEVEAIGDGSPLPLVVRVFDEQPDRPFTKADLVNPSPSRGSGVSGLAKKLHRHSLHKVASPTPDEAAIMTSYFPRATGPHDARRAAHQAWWRPVLEALQAPGEPPPRLYTNNARVPLPWPGTWMTAYRAGGDNGRIGVFLGGSDAALRAFWARAEPQLEMMRAALPTSTSVEEPGDRFALGSVRRRREFMSEQKTQNWLSQAAGNCLTVLRPLMREILKTKA